MKKKREVTKILGFYKQCKRIACKKPFKVESKEDPKLYCSDKCEKCVPMVTELSKIYIPKAKKPKEAFHRGSRTKKSKRKNKYKHHRKDDNFYSTREWKELRYKVISYYGPTCMLCRCDKGSMHVDHIKPRSKHPHLELVFNNLQVLCRACNEGKSNKDDTDFRPETPAAQINLNQD